MMESKGFFLSHFLTSDTPGYGGSRGFEKEQGDSIKNGGSCNSSLIKFNTHVGTHIDLPFHFSDQGKKLEDYPASFWRFKKISLWEKPSSPDEIITPENSLQKSVSEDCQLLLIKTGFEQHRGSELYWKNNPAISPEIALWLRTHRRSVRAIGLDTISLTGYQNRSLGKSAHKAFLAPENGDNPILIIEDMRLSELKSTPNEVIVSPLLIHGADGVQVTVTAW